MTTIIDKQGNYYITMEINVYNIGELTFIPTNNGTNIVLRMARAFNFDTPISLYWDCIVKCGSPASKTAPER
jgi:hypothetical protein